MISAEILADLREMSATVAIKGQLLIELLDEVEAARARIAELEHQLNERGLDIVNQQQLLNSIRAQGLSQEDREAIQFAAYHLGHDSRNESTNRVAAILRRLGGQTT